jgi:hypothetical protein
MGSCTYIYFFTLPACNCKCKKKHLHVGSVSVMYKKPVCKCKSFTLIRIIHAVYTTIDIYKHNIGVNPN